MMALFYYQDQNAFVFSVGNKGTIGKMSHTIEATNSILGPVVQNPINDNPRLKVNQGVYFLTPRCCSTLIFGKTLHQKKSILKSKIKQKKLSLKS